MSDHPLIILGAGPAGMAAAMELQKAGRSSIIIEKAAQVGGLAKTIVFEEKEGTYRTDIGPHRFFSKNKYLYDFIEDLLGEQWMTVHRLTRFVIDGKFYFYPVRLSNVLSQIGFFRAIRTAVDYAIARVRSIIAPRQMVSFEDYAVSTFGRSLAEFNMLNYTEKIWGLPCSEISVDWAQQRIGGLSVFTTLRKALLKRGGPKSLVDIFYYPSHGSGTIYEAIAKRITAAGCAIHTESEPTRIHWSGDRVTAVDVRMHGKQQSLSVSDVICSIPLTQAVTLFSPAPPKEVLDAAAALRFRSQVYLFLMVDGESVSKDNWIYFPDKNIPFGRIAEMKNFSAQMCPPGKTSLFVEYFCFEGDRIWTMEKDALFALTMEWLERLQILQRDRVLRSYLFRQPHVYPLYDLHYRQRVSTVLQWFDRFQNFHAIGRPGRFRYTNQDHSLEMGILAARSILDGTAYDIDQVGAGKEYFERGYVKVS